MSSYRVGVVQFLLAQDRIFEYTYYGVPGKGLITRRSRRRRKRRRRIGKGEAEEANQEQEKHVWHMSTNDLQAKRR